MSEDEKSRKFSDTEPTIDPSSVKAIRSLADPGEEDFYKELTDVYFERSPKVLLDIKNAVEKNDVKAYESSTHSLKGSSGNIGAMALAAQCEKMEHDARNNTMDHTKKDLEKVENLYKEAVTEIQTKYLKLDKAG